MDTMIESLKEKETIQASDKVVGICFDLNYLMENFMSNVLLSTQQVTLVALAQKLTATILEGMAVRVLGSINIASEVPKQQQFPDLDKRKLIFQVTAMWGNLKRKYPIELDKRKATSLQLAHRQWSKEMEKQHSQKWVLDSNAGVVRFMIKGQKDMIDHVWKGV